LKVSDSSLAGITISDRSVFIGNVNSNNNGGDGLIVANNSWARIFYNGSGNGGNTPVITNGSTFINENGP